MYRAVTNNIAVEAEVFFLDDQSEPKKSIFLWAYRIRIKNEGDAVVRLRSRHWRITDAQGRLHEVRGTGVVGEQPHIEPGESFEYVSGTPLNTPSGTMVGSYAMQHNDGALFEVKIPAFALESPYEHHHVH